MSNLGASRAVPSYCAPLPASRQKILVARDEDRPGWFYVVESFDEHEAALHFWPGVRELEDRTLVPFDLILAHPDTFAVYGEPLADGREAVLAKLPERWETRTGVALDLAPHQREGVAFLASRPGGILAFDLGLGKTITALAAAELLGIERALIIAPLNAQPTWCGTTSDPRRYFGLTVTPLEGVARARVLGESWRAGPPGAWLFCNPAILEEHYGFIAMQHRPELLIVDEVHQLRGRTAKATRKLHDLARLRSVRARFALSATPMVNDRLELHSALNTIWPGAFGSWVTYGVRYAGGHQDLEHGHWLFAEEPEDLTHTDEFERRLHSLMLRRTVFDVPRARPDAHITVHDVPDAALDLTKYRAAERDVYAFLRGEGASTEEAGASADPAVRIGRLCSLLSSAKAAYCADLVGGSVVGNVRGGAQTAVTAAIARGKVVVFTWYVQTAAAIVDQLRAGGVATFGPATGQVQSKKRFAMIDAFAEHDGPAVLIATLGSSAESSNKLVCAPTVIFADLTWDPVTLLQALGRLDRPGQTQEVHAIVLRAPNTIEDHMIALLLRKAGQHAASGLAHGVQRVTNALDPEAATSSGRTPLEDLLAEMFDEAALEAAATGAKPNATELAEPGATELARP